jgi:phosphoglycerate dehydrogenase-like enzyme
MRRLKVLYLPNAVLGEKPWSEDAICECSRSHDLQVFDPDAPAEPQFEGVDVVVDMGGGGTPEQFRMARDAGVRFVQSQTTGLDHVPVALMKELGIKVAHCPGTLSAVALAESAMMFILMLAHRYAEAKTNFRERELYSPVGLELVGKTLSLIGFGASAVALARRAKSFDMRVMAIDIRKIDDDIIDEIGPEFLGTPDDLDRIISEADYLSPHLHLTPATRHTIDARRIGLMKPTAFLVNVARGALVDEETLYDALLNGRIAGAGLDVFSTEPFDPTIPVFDLPNVIATPHTAGVTDGTSRNRARFAAENLDRWAQDLEPLGLAT